MQVTDNITGKRTLAARGLASPPVSIPLCWVPGRPIFDKSSAAGAVIPILAALNCGDYRDYHDYQDILIIMISLIIMS